MESAHVLKVNYTSKPDHSTTTTMAPNTAIASENVASLLHVLTASANTFGNALSSDGSNGKVRNGVNGVNDANGHISPHDVERARISLLETCETLLNVVSKPKERLKNMVLVDKFNIVSLQIINHYNIATLVPSTGQISISELAATCNLPSDILTRVLRQAMTFHVFMEPELEICLPSTMSLLSWMKEDGTKHKSPFQLAHSTTDTWWGYAEKRPALTQNYGKYMALITSGGPHDVSHVVNGFSWDQLGSAIVVDIGGADGFVGTSLATAYPNLSIIIQDSAKLKPSADSKIPVELKPRVFFAPHSFFDPQPVLSHQADVFLLRHILHDWEDADCITILRHILASMKPGARIIVAEQVLAPPHTGNAQTEKIMRALDMQMLVQFCGKERTLDDWEALFKRADPNLEIVGCVRPEGSADTLLELKRQA